MSAALQERPEIKIKLTVVKGPHEGQVFQLNKDIISIGRGPENNVVLMNDPQISRMHAQVAVVDNQIEVSNLSQKNALIVEGSSVQKWKLVNSASFVIGDSEIRVEYDLGQAVISIPASKNGEVIPLNQKARAKVAVPPKQSSSNGEGRAPVAKPPAVRKQPIAKKTQQQQQVGMPRPQQQVGMPNPQQQFMNQMPPQGAFDMNVNYQNQGQAQIQGQAATAQNDSLMASPYFKIILIILIAIGFGYSYLSTPNKKTQAKKIASTLKYEDEINNRLASKKEKELEEEREYQLKMKSSPQNFRVNESFLRGMRDYQLGNYVRAQEAFQVVLNLEPDHALARRHHRLATIRFDELVQEKLLLGDSYYKKHNFRMCQSMYTQVMHMLEGKNNDQKYLLAEKKAKECNLANQGIR